MKSETWHRRHAVQIVSALPEDSTDALMVLDAARELVIKFLSDQGPRADLDLDLDRGVVISLSAVTNGASR
jgi:hypothetical protein